MGFGSLGDDYRRRMASGRRTVGKTRGFTLDAVVQMDPKDQRRLEEQLFTAGKKGKRAVRNAHKVSMDELNEAARDRIKMAQFKPSKQRFRRGKGRRTTWTVKGKERSILPFREGIQKGRSWRFQTKMFGGFVVSRTWISSAEYLNYLAPMWEGGFTPAKKTKWQGSPVDGLNWRYGPAREEGANRKVRARMAEAILTQMAEGRTMTPGELKRVLR